MRRIEILLEPKLHRTLTEIAHRENRGLPDLIREMLQKQLEEHKKKGLTSAARILLTDYQNDPELTAFTTLDSEAFRP